MLAGSAGAESWELKAARSKLSQTLMFLLLLMQKRKVGENESDQCITEWSVWMTTFQMLHYILFESVNRQDMYISML